MSDRVSFDEARLGDYFAGEAMGALIVGTPLSDLPDADEVAKIAFDFSAAMLRARSHGHDAERELKDFIGAAANVLHIIEMGATGAELRESAAYRELLARVREHQARRGSAKESEVL